MYRFSQYKNTEDILKKFQTLNGDKKSLIPLKSKFAEIQEEFEMGYSQSVHPELDSMVNSKDFYAKCCK